LELFSTAVEAGRFGCTPPPVMDFSHRVDQPVQSFRFERLVCRAWGSPKMKKAPASVVG
jgi:hypothetical protein